MKRLFTFGCSFTQYYWPTWADIIGKEFDYFENWGRCGAGNVYIANAVVESSIKNKFTKDDTILIMWTSMTREDRYLDKNNKWMTGGNIYSNNCYSEDFVKKYVHVRGCYVRDLAQIYLISEYLEKIGCKHEFMSMVDLNNPLQYTYKDAGTEVNDLLEFYKDTLVKFKPSIHSTIFNKAWYSRPTQPDGSRHDPHPIPSEYLEYLDVVLSELPISTETRDWVIKEDIIARNTKVDFVLPLNGIERL